MILIRVMGVQHQQAVKQEAVSALFIGMGYDFVNKGSRWAQCVLVFYDSRDCCSFYTPSLVFVGFR